MLSVTVEHALFLCFQVRREVLYAFDPSGKALLLQYPYHAVTPSGAFSARHGSLFVNSSFKCRRSCFELEHLSRGANRSWKLDLCCRADEDGVDSLFFYFNV